MKPLPKYHNGMMKHHPPMRQKPPETSSTEESTAKPLNTYVKIRQNEMQIKPISRGKRQTLKTQSVEKRKPVSSFLPESLTRKTSTHDSDIIVTPMHITSRDWLKPKSSTSLRISRNNGNSSTMSVENIHSGENVIMIDETQEFQQNGDAGFDDMIASKSSDGTTERSRLQQTLRRLVEPTIDILIKRKDPSNTVVKKF